MALNMPKQLSEGLGKLDEPGATWSDKGKDEGSTMRLEEHW